MTAEKTNVINRLCSAITSLVTTHNNDSTAHNDIRTNLNNKIDKSVTSGFVKNDGTIDTSTYLTQHQDISSKLDTDDLDTLEITITYEDTTSETVNIAVWSV